MTRVKAFVGLVVLLLFVAPVHAVDELGPDFFEKARGTTVTFYGWGGDPQVNDWLDNTVGPLLKERHGVTLRRVGMDIGGILNRLQGEKLAGRGEGSIDVVWINGENFAAARTGGLLYGPFTHRLPNFRKYVDAASPSVTHDFGHPTEGYEAPFGSARLVFFADTAKIDRLPRNPDEFLELAKAYPGGFAYAAPPDFTGSAFVRTVVCSFVPRDVIVASGVENLDAMTEPAMGWLKELAPFLYQGGKTYVGSNSQLVNMYADGEICMGMSYTPFMAFRKRSSGEFPATTRPFVFDGGTVANTHFLAIPFNAPNRAGAAVLIDLVLSPELQASKMDPKGWGDLPVIDPDRLSDEERERFGSLLTEEEVAFLLTILERRIPELPAAMVPAIEDLWMKTIPGK